MRAGRQILKDYTTGKLLFCKLPPGHEPSGFAPVVAPLPGTVNALPLQQAAAAGSGSGVAQGRQQQAVATAAAPDSDASASDDDDDDDDDASSYDEEVSDDAGDAPAAGPAAAAAPAADAPSSQQQLLLSEADVELMDGLGIGDKPKTRRPDHKFHKKAARSKGNRGLQSDAGGYDGAAISTGKKGGLVRVGGY
jgi:large subunit GTPase 1